MVIYQIINTRNDKRYIGSTVSFNHRMSSHIGNLKNNSHDNKYLQKDWNTFSESDFSFSIIENISDKAELLERETYWISEMNKNHQLYNICMIGGSSLGTVHTEETKSLMSKKKKGVYVGRKLTREWKENISKATRGEKSHHWGKRGKETNRFGKKHTQETKKIISDKLSGRVMDEETKKKIGRSCRGKTAKLTQEKVVDIKNLLENGDISQKDIANIFNVSNHAICNIKRGRTWNYVELDCDNLIDTTSIKKKYYKQ